MTDPYLDQPILKTCDRCGDVMTRETRSDFNDEVICTVCVEREMEVKDNNLDKEEI